MVNTAKKGQALVELLIAIALSSILLPALLTGLVASREGKAQSGQRLQATALLKEAVEATRSIREKGFTNIGTNGVYRPQITGAGTEWELVPGSETTNGYTRQINISDAQRDSGGNIVETGGTVDNSTKKVISSVSWTTPQASSVTNTSYFQRYLGNASFNHTSQFPDFDGGSHTNTTAADVPNSVVLTQSPTGATDYGNKFLTTATSSIGSMTTAGHKTSLRFTAQNSKNVNGIRSFIQTETGGNVTYRFGIQTNSGGVPSGTWVGGATNYGLWATPSGGAAATGWRSVTLPSTAALTAGNVYHVVVEHNSGTINGSNFIAIRRSAPRNALYPLNGAIDNQSNPLFKAGAAASWASQDFQPVYELDFSDSTYEGNPYDTNAEISVFGSNWYGEKFSFSGADKIAQSASFYIRRNGNPPTNLNIQIRRVSDNGVVYTGTLATTGLSTTFAYVTHTFSPAPLTLTAGTVYRIIIQTLGGNNNNSYRFQRIDTTSPANYNSITYDSSTSTYTASTSAGATGTWTDTDSSDFGGFYFTIPGTTTYSSSGEFISHSAGSFDTTVNNAAYNNLTWTATIPAGTSLGLQIAASNANPPVNFVGPDGTSATQYTTSPATIMPFNAITGRYIRYKAIFTSNGSATPQLDDVSINYSP